MGCRFTTNLGLLLSAAFVLMCTFAFPGGSVLAALALGLGCLTVITSLAGFALTARGAVQRALDVLAALGGTWLIIVSREFSTEQRKWLCLAMAAYLFGLAVAGLVANERAQRRRLRAVSVRRPQHNGQPPAGFSTRTSAPTPAPLANPGPS